MSVEGIKAPEVKGEQNEQPLFDNLLDAASEKADYLNGLNDQIHMLGHAAVEWQLQHLQKQGDNLIREFKRWKTYWGDILTLERATPEDIAKAKDQITQLENQFGLSVPDYVSFDYERNTRTTALAYTRRSISSDSTIVLIIPSFSEGEPWRFAVTPPNVAPASVEEALEIVEGIRPNKTGFSLQSVQMAIDAYRRFSKESLLEKGATLFHEIEHARRRKEETAILDITKEEQVVYAATDKWIEKNGGSIEFRKRKLDGYWNDIYGRSGALRKDVRHAYQTSNNEEFKQVLRVCFPEGWWQGEVE